MLISWASLVKSEKTPSILRSVASPPPASDRTKTKVKANSFANNNNILMKVATNDGSKKSSANEFMCLYYPH